MFKCDNLCGATEGLCWSSGWWIICLVGMIIVMGLFCFFFIDRIRHGASLTVWESLSKQKNCKSNYISSTISAKDILDKRYAMGEINKEEYDEMKKNLKEF